MDAESKALVLASGGGLLLLGVRALFRRLFGPPPPEDPTVGDGHFGNTPDE
ncbi:MULTISPECIES: hypothetical protein [Myxococcaceae]|uniref:hypothetical protein n=1 Tax=Myxococcaceae TaxID=31 RepID=UPI00129C6419|nr:MULTISPECIES: hypothetical protein [Myxococcaceae]MBF5046611.1 hypothetical protein [Simulacricoccus sp. 17bor-14]